MRDSANASIGRWILAGLTAGAAFVGVLSLVLVGSLYVALPGWLETTIAIALVASTCLYARTLVAALRSEASLSHATKGRGVRPIAPSS